MIRTPVSLILLLVMGLLLGGCLADSPAPPCCPSTVEASIIEEDAPVFPESFICAGPSLRP